LAAATPSVTEAESATVTPAASDGTARLGAEAAALAVPVATAPVVAASAGSESPGIFPPYVPEPDDTTPAVQLEGRENLDYYFGKLTLADLGVKGAVARASHWGDSVLGGDGLTEAIRQRLQKRFGDAGHGFHPLGKYSRWYSHRGVRFQERREWKTCLIIFKCEKDRRFGYGGVSSTSGGGALSVWSTMPEGFGSKLSRFELWYQKRPDGGGFEIRVDGEVARVVDSRAPAVSDDVERLDLPDGAHEIQVAALNTGIARGYGAVLERNVPGAVWEEMSLIGSFTQRLDYQDAEHISGQVRRRDVDLLVYIFGGNDLSREHGDLKTTTLPYEQEYARVIRKMRAGKPQAACLIMSLTDHALRVDGAIVSRGIVPRLVHAQRKVALEEGCGFFDTFMAMGGTGAIARGREEKPPLASPDLRHPTVAGQRRIGSLLYAALMHGYAEYRRRNVGQPLPLLSPPNPAG
jgi:lysophospholipase L1-like esterase